MTQRHKIYLPKDFDLVEYDQQLLEKQIELEIMRIKVNPGSNAREVTRQPNEIGKFNRLTRELEGIAK